MLLICVVAQSAGAHEVTISAEQSIVQDLRSVASQIRHARARLDQTLSTKPAVVQSQLTMAQARFYRGDYGGSVQYLLAILARPSLKAGPIKAELLSWLGESYLKLQFHDAAVSAFAQAVTQPGQGRSALAHRMTRLFQEVRSNKPKMAIFSAWSAYENFNPKRDDQYSVLRYLYGRALYRAGAYKDSAEVFRQMGPQDPRYVRGQYFLGVLHLREQEILAAKPRFEAAYEAWLKRDKALNSAKPTLLVDEAPPKERLTLIEVDESSPGFSDHGELGASIRLTMARLAARDDKLETAWQFYRGVPPGSTDYARAQSESVYVLSRLRDYLWAARAVGNHHAPHAYSVPAVQSSLQRARYLAKGGQFDASASAFKIIEKQVGLMREDTRDSPATQAKLALNEDYTKWKRIGPTAKRLRADLVDIQETFTALAKLGAGQAPLPMVNEGERVIKSLKTRLIHIGEHISDLKAVTHQHVKGLSQARLSASHKRLFRRLVPLAKTIVTYRSRYQALLSKALRSEKPRLRTLEKRLAAETRSISTFQARLPAMATQRLNRLDSGAVLGQVNIAYWQKEAVSDEIMNLLKKQKQELDGLDPEGHRKALIKAPIQPRSSGRKTSPSSTVAKPPPTADATQ